MEYANSFKGKGIESDELKEIIRLAIIDGAKWADAHPQQPSLPSNLDEAAHKYADREDPVCTCEECLIKTFKAGAEWIAGQGETQEHFVISSIKGSPCSPVVVCYTEEFAIGDEVIVQIRKKKE